MSFVLNPFTGLLDEIGSSSSTTPGGSDTQLQYNNAGSFGGTSGLTWNSATSTLSATTLLMGSGTVGAPAIAFTTDVTTGFYRPTSGQIGVSLAGALRIKFLATSGGGAIDILGGASSEYFLAVGTIGSGDLKFVREATGVFAQRNGTNAQSHRVYNTYTDASNYERGVFDWSTTANILTIGTQKAGTGSTRGVQFVIGGTSIANFSTSGNLVWNTDNTYDIGASEATRPRNIYAGGNIFAGSANYFRWPNRAKMQSPADSNITISNNAGTDFNLLQFGNATSSFPALKRSTTTLQVRLADDSAFTLLESSQIKTNNGTFLVSGTALTNGAAAALGTLTNAPAAGDPTKWIPIDDNGTTRYIPCW